ncbi:MAG: hypothetical protein K6F75_10985 [Butyrivibrio sp.]|nr:hypothetical protein [Butyrivibrio sp.]
MFGFPFFCQEDPRSYEDEMMDIREDNQYKKIQQKQFRSYNILYRTIYFAANFPSCMPDIEYSDTAVKSYQKLDCYKNWDVADLKGSYGKRLITPSGTVIAADLMTGWWIPFKYFMKLETWVLPKSGKNRKQYLHELVEICPKEANEEAILSWMTKNSGRNKKSCKALLDFLSVVYTEGNMIPIITNFKPGRSLDGWDTKMMNIFDDDIKTTQAKVWRRYVTDTFGSKENFVEKNHLSSYMDFESPKKIWNPLVTYKSASDQDWTDYFNTMTKNISKRTAIIAKNPN